MTQVSVIIPVYNTEKYLPKCLESVCNQTLKDIEIICVNDASPDGSLAILQEYAKNDNRIKLINFTENKGAAAARNAGIDVATGEYIGFVDSDDFVDLDFYEKLYSKAKETDADAVKGKLYLYDLNTNRRYLESWIDINNKIKKHQAYFYFTFTSAIYKRSLIQKNKVYFLDGLIHFEDPYFTIKANLFYKKLCVLDDACYYYTDNPNSSSRKNISIKHIQSMALGAKEVLNLINTANIDEAHYKIVFNFVINQLLSWANRVNCNNEINLCAVDAIFDVMAQCKYKKACLQFYFLEKKEEYRGNIFNELRNKLGK